jgi:hypothetical protein
VPPDSIEVIRPRTPVAVTERDEAAGEVLDSLYSGIPGKARHTAIFSRKPAALVIEKEHEIPQTVRPLCCQELYAIHDQFLCAILTRSMSRPRFFQDNLPHTLGTRRSRILFLYM